MSHGLTDNDADRIIDTIHGTHTTGFYTLAEISAHENVMKLWIDQRPDDLRTLRIELRDEDEESVEEIDDDDLEAAWSDLIGVLHFNNPENTETITLVPYWNGVDGSDISDEVEQLCREVGYDILDGIREELRSIQEETLFSPREFVALILKRHKHSNYSDKGAAEFMNISVGNYQGKYGTVSNKITEAEYTLTVVEDLS